MEVIVFLAGVLVLGWALTPLLALLAVWRLESEQKATFQRFSRRLDELAGQPLNRSDSPAERTAAAGVADRAPVRGGPEATAADLRAPSRPPLPEPLPISETPAVLPWQPPV